MLGIPLLPQMKIKLPSRVELAVRRHILQQLRLKYPRDTWAELVRRCRKETDARGGSRTRT